MIAGALFAGFAMAAHAGCSKTYTINADFAEGVLFNVNRNAPNSDQLQLNDAGSIQTLPGIYIANAGGLVGPIEPRVTVALKQPGARSTAKDL